ncbi:MAG: hypothetical protein JJ934_07595 [Pseudomonadales bacterium]|nr:hypothetical protein [Pseudomonadales bacterium]MBO6564766.1 hypothetical protein [Pseudomonadales bacterium]MBO6595875.1 hypothetical protein [Pseudomonadales bacterium]MBO6656740.1 hypothetical protein [Pseudomonadales bacterium]MBO6702480.1 hypothetical protein [Pseudomonadales bacterium]
MKIGLTLAVSSIGVLQALDIPICHASKIRLVLDDVIVSARVDQPQMADTREPSSTDAASAVPSAAFEPLDPDGKTARVSDEPMKNLVEDWSRAP